jgi:hypothetical protein
MVGTITLYDDEGERIDTIYLANTPESGKATFFEKMDTELERVRSVYPEARKVPKVDYRGFHAALR